MSERDETLADRMELIIGGIALQKLRNPEIVPLLAADDELVRHFRSVATALEQSDRLREAAEKVAGFAAAHIGLPLDKCVSGPIGEVMKLLKGET